MYAVIKHYYLKCAVYPDLDYDSGYKANKLNQ